MAPLHSKKKMRTHCDILDTFQVLSPPSVSLFPRVLLDGISLDPQHPWNAARRNVWFVLWERQTFTTPRPRVREFISDIDVEGEQRGSLLSSEAPPPPPLGRYIAANSGVRASER